MNPFPRLFRRRFRDEDLQLGEPQPIIRHPLTGRGNPLVVTQGPTLDEWRLGIRTDNGSRRQYGQLERTLGSVYAELFVDLVADSVALRERRSLAILTPAVMAGFIEHELETYRSRKRYVDSLMMQAVTGHLGTLLNNSIRPETDYYTNALIAGLDGRELAIDQAANWICGNYEAALPSTRQLLVDYIPATRGHGGIMGDHALGPTERHLRDLHLAIAPDTERFRFVSAGTNYPSSIGGSKLLTYIFQLSAGTNWPPFDSPRWDSIAMFYLASIAHVQAFADGNKRTAHLAYAIVLIKNTHSFKAPSVALENWLFRMDR